MRFGITRAIAYLPQASAAATPVVQYGSVNVCRDVAQDKSLQGFWVHKYS
ncbi:hypothetical protein OGM63_25150 [Plectonema radiosum NIES-515]|uniref:Uncharacterized protein n=1 Tax=Plectonema radiosum NIES-515 TaxID=2986073 RepID=A0ABT3B5V2_9CYAN|nr:hypothetical protein [Plectonema radiosum]MCV3216751.1 hypothetical protein [Plectonema radiosum NIES-515]